MIVTAAASPRQDDQHVQHPGHESQQADSRLQQKLPAASGASTQVVFAAGGHRQPGRAAPGHRGVQPVPGQDDLAGQARRAGHRVYNASALDVKTSTVGKLDPAVSAARATGIQVEFSGAVYPRSSAGAIPEGPELIALIITFGSFLAAASPIITALFGIVVATMSMTALASVVSIAGAATSVATMLGISCGIDYALFILSRHCAYILAGYDPREAADRAVGSAGNSVAFAGLSVIIALCGLSVGILFLTAMGLAAAGTVLIGLLIALTLLPAAFGFAGQSIRTEWRVVPLLGRPVGTPS